MIQPITKFKFTWKRMIITLVVIIVASVINDMIRINRYKLYPVNPHKEIRARQDRIYLDLSNGIREIDWTGIDGALEFIDHNYDCSDFKMVNLIDF